MPNQQVTVGLAIGLPGGLVLLLVLILWIRNRRKQKQEDLMERDIDLDLREDTSFSEFQQELHKPYNGPQKSPILQADAERQVEKRSISSTGSASSTNIIDTISKTPQKTPSSYDFYDSVIPMLPESHKNDFNTETPSTPTRGESHSSISLIAPRPNEHSLDNLAKKLNSPSLFEKLPSRSATINLKLRTHHAISTNSSSDILNLVQSDAMNDHYTFETDITDSQPVNPSYQRHPYTQYASTGSPSKLPTSTTRLNLNDVVTGVRNASLQNDVVPATSPFKDNSDEESLPEVSYG